MNAPIGRIADPAQPRHDWTLEEVEALFELPFTELVFRAAEVHRRWFDPTELQRSQLLSVKTGGCPEKCGYCSLFYHCPALPQQLSPLNSESVPATTRLVVQPRQGHPQAAFFPGARSRAPPFSIVV